jgi:hypothetical protein
MSGSAESVVINGGFQMPCLYSLSKSSLVPAMYNTCTCIIIILAFVTMYWTQTCPHISHTFTRVCVGLPS